MSARLRVRSRLSTHRWFQVSHQRDWPVLPSLVRPSTLAFRYQFSLVLATPFFFSEDDAAVVAVDEGTYLEFPEFFVECKFHWIHGPSSSGSMPRFFPAKSFKSVFLISFIVVHAVGNLHVFKGPGRLLRRRLFPRMCAVARSMLA